MDTKQEERGRQRAPQVKIQCPPPDSGNLKNQLLSQGAARTASVGQPPSSPPTPGSRISSSTYLLPAGSVTGRSAVCKCGPVSPGLKWEFTLQRLQERAGTGCTHTVHPKACSCLRPPCRHACAPPSTPRISCRSANAITAQHVMPAMEASIHVYIYVCIQGIQGTHKHSLARMHVCTYARM